MPGTPKKRARIEYGKRTGQITTPEPTRIDFTDIEAAMQPPPKPKYRPKGASRERMLELVEIRRQKAAAGDKGAMGGRPHTKLKRAEVEAKALARMVPKALKVLEEQLDDPDERVRQSAAVKVLEWGKGKPAQSVKIDGDQTHTIRYETVVALPDIVALPDAESVLDEIEEGEWQEQPQLLPGEEPRDDDAA